MKKVIDYSTTPVYFYRFICKDINIINTYVGSTISLTRRRTAHKSACINPNNLHHHLLVYKIIRENGGWTNWELVEIENKIVKNKTEALQHEQYLIDLFKSNMNSHNAFLTETQKRTAITQYYENHKTVILEQHRKYYNINRAKLLENNKEYNLKNKSQITNYQRDYRETTKETRREYQIKYKKLHCEKLREYKQQWHKSKKEINQMLSEDINII